MLLAVGLCVPWCRVSVSILIEVSRYIPSMYEILGLT